MTGKVTVVDHPLVQHKLTLMRQQETSSGAFRALAKEISMLLAYEVTRDLKLTHKTIETPLARMVAPVLDGKKVVLVAILRAGIGLIDGMLELIPSARVGHIGLYRHPQTLEAVEYFFKVPDGMADRDVLVADPMLATGHTAVAAMRRLRQTGPRSLKFICLLAAPEGISTFHQHFPEIPIYTAAIDERLNDHAYIVPGLGDAGDRLFGTK